MEFPRPDIDMSHAFMPLPIADDGTTRDDELQETATVADMVRLSHIFDSVEQVLDAPSNDFFLNSSKPYEIVDLEPVPIGPNAIQVADPRCISLDSKLASSMVPLFSSFKDEMSNENLKRTSFLPLSCSTAAKRFCSGLETQRFKRSSELEDFSLPSTVNNCSTNHFRTYQGCQWQERLEDLMDFKNEHGHCHVPHSYPPKPYLAQWVKRQRYQYKLRNMGRRTTLTDERLKVLETMGFVWDSHRVSWYERLEALKVFKAAHGHCSVPSNFEDKPLAIWVKCQRRQYKLFCKGSSSTMNEERAQELNNLGFIWNPRNLSP